MCRCGVPTTVLLSRHRLTSAKLVQTERNTKYACLFLFANCSLVSKNVANGRQSNMSQLVFVFGVQTHM